MHQLIINWIVLYFKKIWPAAVTSWSDRWQLNLNPAKCEALAITNKRHPVNYTYYIYQKAIDWRNVVRYLGVYIDSKLNWSGHCQIVSSKATKALNCLRLSMFGCSSEAKCKAYKAIVRPILEYASIVWSPHTAKEIKRLESIQNRAAHWACGSRWLPDTLRWSVSTSDCILKLHLPTLEARRQYLSICFLYDAYTQRNRSLCFDQYCTFNTVRSTRSHRYSLVPPISTINARRYSHFVNTCFLWNSLPATTFQFVDLSSFRRYVYNILCVSQT